MRFRLSVMAFALTAGSASAGELVVYPTAVTLTGPQALAQLSAFDSTAGRATAPVTDSAKFETDKKGRNAS